MYKISVVIPAYNRADLLPRTLESVAAQTLKPDEVIIIDDQSPDDTPAVCAALIEKYRDQLPIVYMRHEQNKGEAGSRNTGIRHAQYDYIAFLDSDDEWKPEKLAQQIAYIKQHGVDGVFCESALVENGDYAQAMHTKIAHDTIEAEKLLTRGCGYGVGTNLLIARRAILDHPFDETLKLLVDVDWLYRVAQTAHLDILHECLAYYHKAPMRGGAYVAEHCTIFMRKYEPLIAHWPWYKRRQVRAFMLWNIAFGYQGNDDYINAALNFAKGIVQWPVRNPWHYLFVPINLVKGWLR
ncbi:MAG TPA: glycosyltransferase family 2 protein [Micavibrio sp.]